MDKIEIGKRKFSFKIPSPFDGCAIFDTLTTRNAPFGASAVMGLKSVKENMTPAELETFMKLCLKNCFEELQGGEASVIDEDGEIGITGASAPILTKLTVQYIGFFIEYWAGEASSTSAPAGPVTP